MKNRQSVNLGTSPGDPAGWRAVMRRALDGDTDTLPPEDVEAMRRIVVAAAVDAAPEVMWRRPLALAATVLLMIGVGATAGRRFEARPPAAVSPAEAIRPTGGEQLQLQFATPGGTRIIWVFNSDLDLKATMP